MAEKLNPKKVALSLAIVASVFYIVCALLVAIAPDFTTKLFSNLFHGIDITKIANVNISIVSVLLGLIQIIIYIIIVGWLFAWIYNHLK